MADEERPALTLGALQEIQARFDRAHGFDFVSGPAPPDSMSRTAFTTLALAGEVGELANAMKKAQRAQWLGWDPAPHLRQVSAEVADVLAYLLKLASLLGVDLEEHYLTTLSDNFLRFPSCAQTRGRLYTIAGPSGAGKTTLVRALVGTLPGLVEDVTGNPYLEVLFERPEQFDAFANQRWFLERVSGQLRAVDPAGSVVLDQDPAAIVRVYARMFLADGRLSDGQYRALLRDLLELESDLAHWGGGRRTLFLDARAETLRARAAMRGDVHVPPIAWFERVRGYFHELHDKVSGARVIATDDLSAEEVLAAIREACGFL